MGDRSYGRQAIIADGRTIGLRRYGERDFLAAFAMYAEAVEDGAFPREPPATEEMFRSGWLEGATAVILAADDTGLVGCYFLRPAYRDSVGAHVANAGYMVSRRARRQGIARALLRDSLAEAPRLGFRSMLFMRVAEDSPSRSLYEEHGFTVVGRVPDALGDRAALLYWRSLSLPIRSK